MGINSGLMNQQEKQKPMNDVRQKRHQRSWCMQYKGAKASSWKGVLQRA